ncbi:hypothetical protein Hdeb2414_s0007g00250511 [Helianthus debilis subsp. tardiflorus]
MPRIKNFSYSISCYRLQDEKHKPDRKTNNLKYLRRVFRERLIGSMKTFDFTNIIK